jgi:hypothetical protein
LMKKTVYVCGLAVLWVMLNSCLGAQADISIRANGSGKIALEYRVSSMLESMGRLDGNERWPAIPVGRADFERTVARIPGLRLKSFSAKEVRNRATGGSDLVTKVTLEFNHTDALLAFLDASGGSASLIQNSGKNTLRLVLQEPVSDGINSGAINSGAINSDLISLLQESAESHAICFSFSLPKNASLSVIPPSAPSAQVVSQGKKVSFAIGLGELIGREDGLALEIVW